MFSSINDSGHPFVMYKQGQVVSYGNSHYLRIYPNVLWIMTNVEQKEEFTSV